jgi:hypothetical protein
VADRISCPHLKPPPNHHSEAEIETVMTRSRRHVGYFMNVARQSYCWQHVTTFRQSTIMLPLPETAVCFPTDQIRWRYFAARRPMSISFSAGQSRQTFLFSFRSNLRWPLGSPRRSALRRRHRFKYESTTRSSSDFSAKLHHVQARRGHAWIRIGHLEMPSDRSREAKGSTGAPGFPRPLS